MSSYSKTSATVSTTASGTVSGTAPSTAPSSAFTFAQTPLSSDSEEDSVLVVGTAKSPWLATTDTNSRKRGPPPPDYSHPQGLA
jgi:hypothetical protein